MCNSSEPGEAPLMPDVSKPRSIRMVGGTEKSRAWRGDDHVRQVALGATSHPNIKVHVLRMVPKFPHGDATEPLRVIFSFSSAVDQRA